jgi:CheY-like chemotaxis protein
MVLIIDDDVNFGTSVERIIRYMGHEVVLISRPLEAIELLRIRRPLLIVLDLELPEMSGLTFLRAIRQEPRNLDIPVMIFSADFSAQKMREAMDAGAREYLVKGTIGWASLAERIAKHLPGGAASS